MTSRRIHCVGRVSRETQAARRCAPDYHSSDQSPSAVISGAGITQHGELRSRCALIVRPLCLAILLMGKVSAHVSRETLAWRIRGEIGADGQGDVSRETQRVA